MQMVLAKDIYSQWVDSQEKWARRYLKLSLFSLRSRGVTNEFLYIVERGTPMLCDCLRTTFENERPAAAASWSENVKSPNGDCSRTLGTSTPNLWRKERLGWDGNPFTANMLKVKREPIAVKVKREPIEAIHEELRSLQNMAGQSDAILTKRYLQFRATYIASTRAV